MEFGENKPVFFDNEKSVYSGELQNMKLLDVEDYKKLVIFLADQSIDCYVAYFYLSKSNFSIMMLNSKVETNALNEIIQRYKPNHIVLPKEKISKENYLRVKSQYGSYLFTEYNSSNLKINSELKYLIPTSGTTGAQKFVKLSEKNIQCNTQDIIDYLSITHNDVAPSNLPISYSYGLSVLNSHLAAGASIYVTSSSLMERSFASDLQNARITNINGVPTFWEFAKRMQFFQNFPDTLRFITQAGGHLSNEVKEEIFKVCLEQDISLYVMYGQTECSPRMSYLNVNKYPSKIGSIGKPIASGTFKIIKRDDITDIDSGELEYEGPNVGMGYSTSYNDLSYPDQWNGKIATGDIAKVDSNGFYFIMGRLKRFCKISGVRIDLDVCQSQVRTFTETDNAFIIGKDECLYILSTEKLNLKNLKEFTSNIFSIAPSKIKFIQVQTFPMNNGKISYRELEDMI